MSGRTHAHDLRSILVGPAVGLFTETPLALLPVRIETAFDGATLVIRVYPDEIHIDRGAEVAPGAPVPAARPRLLPDRWIAVGWRAGVRVFVVEGPAIDEAALRIAPDLAAPDPNAGMAWLHDLHEAERVGMVLRVPLDVPRLDRLVVLGVRGSLDPTAGAAALAELLAVHAGRGALGFVAPGTPTNQVGPGERPPAAPIGSAGGRADARTAAALGIPAAPTLQALPGADRDEDTIARAMNTALWPATWGYFVPHLFAPEAGDTAGPVVAPVALDAARAHFAAHVRPGGSLPVLRIGPQPYGLLPAISLDQIVPEPGDLPGLIDLLRRLRPVWRAAAPAVDPHTADGAALLSVLSIQPASIGFDARSIVGRRTIANLFAYLDVPDHATWSARQDQLGVEALRAVGLPWRPRIAHTQPEPASFAVTAPLVEVAARRLIDVTALHHGSINFIEWLRDADVHALRTQVNTPRPPPPVVTGAMALIHAPRDSLLWGVLRHATLRAHADVAARIAGLAFPEPELIDVASLEPQPPTPWALFDRVLPQTGGRTLAAYLRAATTPDTAALVEHRDALTLLAHQPADALARHFVDTLDACSYRLDAWITSIAARRLARVRARQPAGVHIGAYGWVENLQPRAARASEGHVHTPSLAHAHTAAILRSGYRARRLAGDDAGALAVDLSSARVRAAAWILDGARRGLPLPALLGQRLERALHDHDPPLDDFIPKFRAVRSTADGTVVDGIEVVRKWQAGELETTFAWGDHKTDLEAALAMVAEAVDAIGDLMLAEGVHQVVRGNPEAASATFDALGRGDQPPPELSVIRTPRPAIHHTARLVVALDPEPPAASPAWPDAPLAARGPAAPPLETWARAALGAATAARVEVAWRAGGAAVHTEELAVSDLGLSALDIVYLVDRLDDWFAWLARARRPASVAADAALSITPRRSLVELRAIARALRRVIVAARPTGADQFAVEAPPVPTAPVVDDRASRADSARAALAARADALDAARAGTDDLAIVDALAGLAAFGIPVDLAADPATVRDRATAALGVLAGVFGETVPAPAIIELGAAPRAAFVARGIVEPGVLDWLGAVGRVRAAVGAVDDAVVATRALGRGGALGYAQLPDVAGEPAIFTRAVVDRPRVAIVAYAPTGTPLTRIAALAIDEWVEAVPTATQTSGLAFHYDRPDAQPPQAILLAVPPDLSKPWTTDAIAQVIAETLDLAAIRAAPPEALGAIAQLVPAIALAFNAAGDAITTDLTAYAE